MKPVLLVIRDGWGENHNPKHDKFNAVKLANGRHAVAPLPIGRLLHFCTGALAPICTFAPELAHLLLASLP